MIRVLFDWEVVSDEELIAAIRDAVQPLSDALNAVAVVGIALGALYHSILWGLS